MSELISRQAAQDVVNAICERCGKYKEYNGVMCGTCALDGVEDSIEDLPSAEPKRGKWVITGKFADTIHAKCSECKRHQIFYYGKQPTNYCPECGARMTDDD